MKALAVFCITILLMATSLMAQNCDGCNPVTHCCVNYGLWKSCTAKKAEGGSCGGAFLCSDCLLPSVCRDNERSVVQTLSIGTGTCVGVTKIFGLKR